VNALLGVLDAIELIYNDLHSQRLQAHIMPWKIWVERHHGRMVTEADANIDAQYLDAVHMLLPMVGTDRVGFCV
jgi:hypothetical protein